MNKRRRRTLTSLHCKFRFNASSMDFPLFYLPQSQPQRRYWRCRRLAAADSIIDGVIEFCDFSGWLDGRKWNISKHKWNGRRAHQYSSLHHHNRPNSISKLLSPPIHFVPTSFTRTHLKSHCPNPNLLLFLFPAPQLPFTGTMAPFVAGSLPWLRLESQGGSLLSPEQFRILRQKAPSKYFSIFQFCL